MKMKSKKAVWPQQYNGSKAYDWESLDSLEEKNAKKPPLVVGIRGKMDLNKIENNPKNEKIEGGV